MKKTALLFLLMCTHLFVYTQVFTNTYTSSKVSKSGLFGNRSEIRTHTLSEFVQVEEKRDSSINDADKPYEFAKVRFVDLSIDSGNWENSTKDTAVWRLKIVSPKALSISINFDRFYLPAGTEMYIYNEEGTMITGPVTASENNPEKTWGSSIYSGAGAIIEVKLPKRLQKQIDLHINSIAHGYKNMFREKSFGESGSCNINVLCPLGNGWDTERNSVALVLNASGNEHCSGSLINNTCENLRPYLLTANHCYTASSAVSNWRFIFQYWSPSCSPNQNGSRSVLFNGAVLRANSAISDFALLELNQIPPSNSGITYSGWSRSASAPALVTGIHHPSGDVMKISRDNDPAFKTAYLGGTGSSYWEVNWDQGVTEGGSSGSALFDPNKRIIGQLYGGYSACNSADKRDWYGAFDVSWNGGGTSSTRLSSWLDPAGSGTVTTDAVGASKYSIAGPEAICSEEVYSFSNLPAGASVTWTIAPAGIVSRQDIGNTIRLTKQTEGTVTITATVNICGYNLQRTRSVRTTSSYSDLSGFYFVNGTYHPLVNEISGSNNVSPGTWTVIHATSSTSNTPQWTPVGGFGYSWQIDSYQELNVNVQSGGYAAFDMSINTVCGPISGTYIFETGNPYNFYTLAPNPAISDVSIFVDEEKIRKAGGKIAFRQGIQNILLTDKTGKVIWQRKYSAAVRNAVFNVSTLKPDIYIVKIFDGKKWQVVKLMKK